MSAKLFTNVFTRFCFFSEKPSIFSIRSWYFRYRGKTILLPCDDPEWSNFTKFFAQNFENFGIKKLISTSFAVESKNIEIDYEPSLFESIDPRFDKTKTRCKGKQNYFINKDGHIVQSLYTRI